MGYVYKITCVPSNKSYIGISIHEPEKRRIKQHLSGGGNRLLAKDLEKYGRDVFIYETLEENVFPDLLSDLEVFYISKFNTVAPNGYNLDSGGRGYPSKGMSGKKHSIETCQKISEGGKGKKHSPETRKKISEANSGENNAMYGRTGKNNPAYGKSWNKGKTHSMETRQKMSNATRGKNNPAYGKPPWNIRPEYNDVKQFFVLRLWNMPPKERNKQLYNKYPNIPKGTIRAWVCKWQSEQP